MTEVQDTALPGEDSRPDALSSGEGDEGPPLSPCRRHLWASSHDGALWLIDIERESARRWATVGVGSLALATDATGRLWWFPLRTGNAEMLRLDPFAEDLAIESFPLQPLAESAIAGATVDAAGQLWALTVKSSAVYTLDHDTGELREAWTFSADLGQDGDLLVQDGALSVLTAFSMRIGALSRIPTSLLQLTEGDPPAVATGWAEAGGSLWISDVDGDMHRLEGETLRWRFNVGGPLTDLSEVRGTLAQCAQLQVD